MDQLRENRRLTVWIVVGVAAITWAIQYAATGAPYPKDLWTLLQFLGIPAAAAFAVVMLWNRHLWRLPPSRWFWSIPDLSGRWEGWYCRALTKEWQPTAHEISQRALDLTAQAWGPGNWSRSTLAGIITDPHRCSVQFIWTYQTEPTEVMPDAGATHGGAHFLRFSERCGRKYLEGKYVNDRVRHDKTAGATGIIRLIWVSEKTKGDLAFSAETWLPKPQDLRCGQDVRCGQGAT